MNWHWNTIMVEVFKKHTQPHIALTQEKQLTYLKNICYTLFEVKIKTTLQ